MFPIPTRRTSIVLVTLIFVAAAACDAAAQGPERTYPSLIGAVKKPPAWLGKEVPFDVAAYFAAPPPGQNAAPLYLDAIFEFSRRDELLLRAWSGDRGSEPDGP